MILFVFEGEKCEPNIFEAIKRVFNIGENIVCTYNTSIHSLYLQLSKNDWDLFPALQEQLRKRGDNTLDAYRSSDVGQVYLFFDYDFHDKHVPLEQLNEELITLLGFFNEETDHGKLYINYPMVEAIRYTKKLPDDNYWAYVVKRSECGRFKCQAAQFSDYADYGFLHPAHQPNAGNDEARTNWNLLIDQNVKKANFVCYSVYAFPENKGLIGQKIIFDSQLAKYVLHQEEEKVAVLSAFPLFLYEYLK